MYVLYATSRNDYRLTHCNVGLVISIDMLPDEVLLEIFHFYVVEAMEEEDMYLKNKMSAWQTLVHVCRRWRGVVFRSPRRLDLRLICPTKTHVIDKVDVWPALPLVIENFDCQTEDVDNIIALLEHRELVRRISHIELWEIRLEDISKAMEVPFPELIDLALHHDYETEPAILSDAFLGGSAPRLQLLILDNIPFPGLPKLLSSAIVLTDLYLENIPHSGYISPEAMVACLSLLTNLDGLSLQFQSPQSHPDRESRRPPPPKRTVLPALTRFWFSGVSEYIEDLVVRVDAPRLNSLRITFFNDIAFDTPQFSQFIGRIPTFKAFDKASVDLGDAIAGIKLSSKSKTSRREPLNLNVRISCRELDWQVPSLEQICTSSLPSLSTLEDLYIYENAYPEKPVWENNIDSTLWLGLLSHFTTVKNLYLSEEIASHIATALEELVGERKTEVLPSLQNIYLEDSELQPSGLVQPEESVRKFVAARQVTNHPIVVSRCSRDRLSWL